MTYGVVSMAGYPLCFQFYELWTQIKESILYLYMSTSLVCIKGFQSDLNRVSMQAIKLWLLRAVFVSTTRKVYNITRSMYK